MTISNGLCAPHKYEATPALPDHLKNREIHLNIHISIA